jgi:transcriptional regulator with XRE-family HTH domain
MTREEWMKAFGDSLQYELDIKGIKQRTLSRMTGIPTSSISAYIKGTAMPSALAVVKIANVLNADYFDLLDFGESVI